MVKKILLMGALCLIPIFIYYLFFSYERFETGPHQLSNPKYGTYVYVGTADQVEYAEKLHRRAIGKTVHGDKIYELKNDPNHEQLIFIPNTEMPWWDLYQLRK